MADWYEKQTIGLLPERAARRWGTREALAFQANRWTFAELHAGVDAAAWRRSWPAQRPRSCVRSKSDRQSWLSRCSRASSAPCSRPSWKALDDLGGEVHAPRPDCP